MMQSLLNLKALLLDVSLHITFVEMGIFMLGFLVFVLVVFVALIFWHNRLVFFIASILEVCILASIPFGMAFVVRHYIFPIDILSSHLNPLTYTTGFSFKFEFKNKSKHNIKECVFSVVALREEKTKGDKIRNIFLPLGSGSASIKLDLKPHQSYVWSGIIDGYNFPNQSYKTALDCH